MKYVSARTLDLRERRVLIQRELDEAIERQSNGEPIDLRPYVRAINDNTHDLEYSIRDDIRQSVYQGTKFGKGI